MNGVSIIVPCYNAQEWIRETLNCVKAQNSQYETEVLVVDDGSTDESAGIVRNEFPWVRLICVSWGGPSRARNIGIKSSCGDFVQFLDADDLLGETKVDLQVQALIDTEADVAYGDWQYLVGRPDGQFVLDGMVAHSIQGLPEVALFTYSWYPIHAYLFRRTIVERTGGFRENLPIIQDARFALDCALHGAEFVYCPGTTVQYRMHSVTQNSKRDPVGFTRDCFRNAAEIQQWWKEHGGLNTERYSALLQVYEQIARASFGTDSLTFDAAYAALERLSPGYAPSRPKHLAFFSKLVGYRNAEALATRYRQVKSLLNNMAGILS